MATDFGEPPSRTPTKELSFVFTDVEGSTALISDSVVDGIDILMGQATMICAIAARFRGRVFRNIGDSVCASFESVDDAVACASEILQQSKARRDAVHFPVKHRAAVATGIVAEWPDDYFGAAAHLVSRLLDCSHAGQLLVCEDTANRINGEFSIRSLGAHYLKGFDAPKKVYQVDYPGSPATFPPLRSLKAAWTNLPHELDRFVGRASDIAALDAAYQDARLVTLLGPGGIGKTRLAKHWAAAQSPSDGVWFVGLASVTEPALVAQSVCEVLGIADEPSVPTSDVLCESLAASRALIILDNCEHVAVQAAALAYKLLQRCPHIRLLATSRSRLGVAGERSVRLGPLQGTEFASPGVDVSRLETVQLFVDRAAAARPGFELAAKEVALAAEICRRVDGIPLAIELVAARVASLSVKQLSERLATCLTIADPSASDTGQQRTLESTIRWSFDLLGNEEYRTALRLSVFAGGLTLEAAEEVCGNDDVPRAEILRILSNLVDKSLLVFETGGEDPRYRMLETIREFAASELGRRSATETFHAHARWAVNHVEAISIRSFAEPADVNRAFETELSNYRAVMQRALKTIDPVYGVRVCVALYRYWITTGLVKEPLDWLVRLLELPSEKSDLTVSAMAHAALGGLARRALDYGLAATAFEHSFALWNSSGYYRGVADANSNLGLLAMDQGRYAEALGLLKTARNEFDRLGDSLGAHVCDLNLAFALLGGGDPVGAKRAFARSVTGFREIGDEWAIASAQHGLGLAEVELGATDKALSDLTESLIARSKMGDRPGMLESAESFAALYIRMGRAEEAAMLLGATNAQRVSWNVSRTGFLRRFVYDVTARIEQAIGGDHFDAMSAKGKAIGFESSIELVLRSAERAAET